MGQRQSSAETTPFRGFCWNGIADIYSYRKLLILPTIYGDPDVDI